MKENNETKLNVSITGDEYLNILKYKESKKIDFTTWNWGAIAGFFLAGLGIIALAILLSEMYSPPAETFEFTWHGVLMFMGVAAGLGWIFHGTGFLLVRR